MRPGDESRRADTPSIDPALNRATPGSPHRRRKVAPVSPVPSANLGSSKRTAVAQGILSVVATKAHEGRPAGRAHSPPDARVQPSAGEPGIHPARATCRSPARLLLPPLRFGRGGGSSLSVRRLLIAPQSGFNFQDPSRARRPRLGCSRRTGCPLRARAKITERHCVS
jgi:hypothetical protein